MRFSSSFSTLLLLGVLPYTAQSFGFGPAFLHTPNAGCEDIPSQASAEPEDETPGIDYTSSTMLFFYITSALFLVGFLVYSILRHFKMTKALATVVTDVEMETPDSAKDDTSDTIQTGYANDSFGSVVYYSLLAMTMVFHAFIFMLCLDFYELLAPATGSEVVKARIFGNTPDLYNLFIIVWHILAVWLVTMKLSSARLRNFFRARVPLSQATTVEIWRRNDPGIEIQNPSAAVRMATKLDDISASIFGEPGTYQNLPVQHSANGARFITYQCLQHSYDKNSLKYEVTHVATPLDVEEIFSSAAAMTSDEVNERLQAIGPNLIQVPCITVLGAISDEVFSFFYIYQIQMLWMWFVFAYWKIAAVMCVVIVWSVSIKVYTTIVAERKVKHMAEHIDSCFAFRNGQWKKVATTDLVPGDLIGVETGKTMSCDATVLSGTVVTDESMLTGESRPVRKFPLPKLAGAVYKHESSKHTLYAGTSILQTESESNDVCPSGTRRFEATAVVASTGANTFKGEMVRSILFPQPIQFTFDMELRIVLIILFFWGAVAALLIFLFTGDSGGAWFYAMCAFVVVLSPLLPAMLVVGQTIGARRLAQKQVNCLQVRRVTLAGKVSVACFDKTGTLTKQGLQFNGAQAIHTSKHTGMPSFSRSHRDINKLPKLVELALATAHSVTMLDGEAVGNPVDIEMFMSSKWKIVPQTQPNDSDPSSEAKALTVESPDGKRAEVLRVMAFEHRLMRMLVVVRDVSSGVVHVFCKGSFESIRDLSNSDSLPDRFDHVTLAHARDGTYTLALAHRVLSEQELPGLQSMSRESLESGLSAAGLILFRNGLKPDSHEAVSLLKKAGVRPVMITGDNALTGICIAREVGMMHKKNAPVFLADLNENGDVVWANSATGEEVDVDSLIAVTYDDDDDDSRSSGDSSQDDNSTVADQTNYGSRSECDDNSTLTRGDTRRGRFRNQDGASVAYTLDSVPSYIRSHLGFELAMTGAAFRKIRESEEDMCSYLLLTRVFARMRPEDKVACVQLHMEAGSIVSMCGDGGNDCAALRASHVGLALSDSDASIVSPFSTTTGSVMSFVELLRQGRSALSTSFASFKFIVLYGEILIFAKILSAYFGVAMAETVWIVMDSIVFVGLSWSLTLAAPAKKLTHRRPTARLLGYETVSSVCGVLAINLIFLVGMIFWLFSKDWFQCAMWPNDIDMTKWYTLGDNFEAELLAFSFIFQVITAAGIFNLGGEFRATWARNLTFVCFFFGLLAAAISLVVTDLNALTCFFRLNCKSPGLNGWEPTWFTPSEYSHYSRTFSNVLPEGARYELLLILLANSAVNWCYQYFGVLGHLRRFLRRSYPSEKPQLPL